MSKIAIVVQRYGADVVGGAEAHAKQLAERLTQDLCWHVEVLTTTAKDYRTWANDYPEGVEILDGVLVRRFNSRRKRSVIFPVLDKLLKVALPIFRRFRFLKALVQILERTWLILQGPYCPELVRYIATHEQEYDRFYFVTYLYYPTLWGYEKVSHKAALIPTAHDEFPFHFEIVRRMLNRVAILLPNAPAEAALVRTKLEPQEKGPLVKVAGLGIDLNLLRPDPSRRREGVVYLGRISRGKKVDSMIEWSLKHFPTTKIHLAGKVEDDFPLPKSPQIEHLGFVDDQQKIALLQRSQCLVNPSEMESLSLIVLEAIACGIPVLVNTHCKVLEHYTKVCPTVFGFQDEEGFVRALNDILATDWQTTRSQELLHESRDWLSRTYSWPVVLEAFLDSSKVLQPRF